MDEHSKPLFLDYSYSTPAVGLSLFISKSSSEEGWIKPQHKHHYYKKFVTRRNSAPCINLYHSLMLLVRSHFLKAQFYNQFQPLASYL